VKEGYDGLINDIETGNLDDPQTFTQYNKNLHDLVKKAAPRYTLGIALDAKQPEQKVQWQDWGPLNKVTDFQIIMALDHYQSSSQTPAATSDSAWIKKTASYISKTMNDSSKVEWELPTYCKLWQWDTNTKKWILKKWCDNSFAKATLENFKKLPKKQQLKDNSQDIKNPYIHFIDKERTESYLFFETPQSLQDMASTVQSLTPKLCTHFSFWDFDKGDMNLANIDKKVKYC